MPETNLEECLAYFGCDEDETIIVTTPCKGIMWIRIDIGNDIVNGKPQNQGEEYAIEKFVEMDCS